MRKSALLAILVALMALSGCQTIRGWFDRDESAKPAELVEFSPTIQVERAWGASIGRQPGRSLPRLKPLHQGDRIWTVDPRGLVTAFDARNGARLLRFDTELEVSAGPAVYDGRLYLGTFAGVVHALNAESGAAQWSAQLSSEILSLPVLHEGVLIVRSGSTRVQRYPFAWAGDNRSSFAHDDGLPSVILSGLNAAMSGIALWGSDIAGYAGRPDKEVFIRWTQFSTFTPFMQVHMTSNLGPWDFDAETLAVFRKFAVLRVQLFPYIYDAAHVAAGHGLERRVRPFIRDPHAEPLEHPVEVLAPGDRYRRRPDGILEHEIPADDPGDELAHRRVRIRVRAAGDGNHRGELGVAEAGERAADAGDDEGQRDRRAGAIRNGGRGAHEQPRADDGPDAERNQRPRTERALQSVLARSLCVGQQPIDRLRPE